jgi:hypothetical protein
MLHTIGLIPGIITSMSEFLSGITTTSDPSSHLNGRPRHLYRLYPHTVLSSLSFHQGRGRRCQDYGRKAAGDPRRRGARSELMFDLRQRQRHTLNRSQYDDRARSLYRWLHRHPNDHVLAALHAAITELRRLVRYPCNDKYM